MSGAHVVDATWIRPRDGRLVIAGSPASLFKVAAAQSRVLDDPSAVSHDEASVAVVDTLVRAGALHRVDPTPVDYSLLTVAVPTRVGNKRDADNLLECVASLAPLRTVVVDDGSSVDVRALLGAQHHCRVVSHDANRGPSAARNTALRAIADDPESGPLVCFVDADVTADPTCLVRLAGHVGPNGVVFAAPRIVAATTRRWLERYEAHLGALDMGPRRARVRLGSRVPYVPTATLVVDRAAASGVGFDESLRTGEDVDFVWRLAAVASPGVYDPAIRVAHRPRRSIAGFMGRRFAYGASAAALARRHGRVASPWSGRAAEFAGWIALVAGAALWWPAALLGAVAVAASVGAAARVLCSHGVDPVTGIRVGAIAALRGASQFGVALTRSWWPVAAAAAFIAPPLGAAVGIVFVASAMRDWVARSPTSGRRLDPVRFMVARAADHVAYGAGLWWGAVRAQRPAALLPAVSPRRSGTR